MNREEMRQYLGVTGYSLGQIEKDYFQHIILSALSRKHAKLLVFKGGTALQKSGIITRFSEDLDFTLNGELSLRRLKQTTSSAIDLYGYPFQINREIDDVRTMSFRLLINGPLYRNNRGLCSIRIEVSKRETIILEPERVEMTPPYRDILSYIIAIMRKEEIIAEKVRALLVRTKPRDLFDLSLLIKSGTSVDLDLVNKKLEYYGFKFDRKSLLVKCKGLKKSWEGELRAMLRDIPPFDKELKIVLDAFGKISR